MKRERQEVLDLPLDVRTRMAMKEAVREALTERAHLGLPSYILRDGKVVELSPEETLKEVEAASKD
jgi:hypothetical protein